MLRTGRRGLSGKDRGRRVSFCMACNILSAKGTPEAGACLEACDHGLPGSARLAVGEHVAYGLWLRLAGSSSKTQQAAVSRKHRSAQAVQRQQKYSQAGHRCQAADRQSGKTATAMASCSGVCILLHLFRSS